MWHGQPPWRGSSQTRLGAVLTALWRDEIRGLPTLQSALLPSLLFSTKSTQTTHSTMPTMNAIWRSIQATTSIRATTRSRWSSTQCSQKQPVQIERRCRHVKIRKSCSSHWRSKQNDRLNAAKCLSVRTEIQKAKWRRKKRSVNQGRKSRWKPRINWPRNSTSYALARCLGRKLSKRIHIKHKMIVMGTRIVWSRHLKKAEVLYLLSSSTPSPFRSLNHWKKRLGRSHRKPRSLSREDLPSSSCPSANLTKIAQMVRGRRPLRAFHLQTSQSCWTIGPRSKMCHFQHTQVSMWNADPEVEATLCWVILKKWPRLKTQTFRLWMRIGKIMF